ncbi:MAG: putative 4-hydroxybenzoate polyprenyltransferase [Acidobacteria bacterium]|nr:putative 4-hydroxybenzoate polyprenyltransferase [Acidobacteriota bacterium]
MLKKLRTTLEMIKIEHTLFALPFAFLGAFFAARGLPSPSEIGWILLAMIGARSAAMAFNRLVDLPFDAKNPRTASRALPRKRLSREFVILFILASSAAFIGAAAMLNPLALKLSPVALAIIFLYSFMKRFTWSTHFFLGLALACAPVGAWVAIRGSISGIPLLLGLAVMLWVAGFDIIYACQDVGFDRNEKLFSIPKRFGIPRALWISGFLHACMIVLLGFLYRRMQLGALSLAGLGVVAILLAYEHSLVRPSDLSRVNAAFFTVNGWISVLLFVTTGIDILRLRVP